MHPRSQSSGELVGVMNDARWEELRAAMHALGPLRPQFQIKDLKGVMPGGWDGDWFHHFRLLPYSTIEWCDVRVRTEAQRLAVLASLRAIHLPGRSTAEGFRVQGWVRSGESVSYIE